MIVAYLCLFRTRFVCYRHLICYWFSASRLNYRIPCHSKSLLGKWLRGFLVSLCKTVATRLRGYADFTKKIARLGT